MRNSGQKAERVATDWLVDKGYRIIANNWKNRFAEIDIIAIKRDAIYFVEVKFRASSGYGSGLEYVHPRKLQRMRRAAQHFMHEEEIDQSAHLAAIEVDNSNRVVGWIDSIFIDD